MRNRSVYAPQREAPAPIDWEKHRAESDRLAAEEARVSREAQARADEFLLEPDPISQLCARCQRLEERVEALESKGVPT